MDEQYRLIFNYISKDDTEAFDNALKRINDVATQPVAIQQVVSSGGGISTARMLGQSIGQILSFGVGFLSGKMVRSAVGKMIKPATAVAVAQTRATSSEVINNFRRTALIQPLSRPTISRSIRQPPARPIISAAQPIRQPLARPIIRANTTISGSNAAPPIERPVASAALGAIPTIESAPQQQIPLVNPIPKQSIKTPLDGADLYRLIKHITDDISRNSKNMSVTTDKLQLSVAAGEISSR